MDTVAPLVVSGFNWARRHKREFDAVLTIEDPGARFGLRFHHTAAPAHLVLKFVDLDAPMPPPYAEHPNYRLASREQVEQGLSFLRQHKSALVHCHAGISRSTAFLLGYYVETRGEDGAYAILKQLRPQASPNRHVLTLIDDVLGSHLAERLDAWDAASVWNARRRMLTRQAYLAECGLWSIVSHSL